MHGFQSTGVVRNARIQIVCKSQSYMDSNVRFLCARVVQQEARSSPRARRSAGASAWGAREPPGCGDSAGTDAGDGGRAAGPTAELCALATGAFAISSAPTFSLLLEYRVIVRMSDYLYTQHSSSSVCSERRRNQEGEYISGLLKHPSC